MQAADNLECDTQTSDTVASKLCPDLLTTKTVVRPLGEGQGEGRTQVFPPTLALTPALSRRGLCLKIAVCPKRRESAQKVEEMADSLQLPPVSTYSLPFL